MLRSLIIWLNHTECCLILWVSWHVSFMIFSVLVLSRTFWPGKIPSGAWYYKEDPSLTRHLSKTCFVGVSYGWCSTCLHRNEASTYHPPTNTYNKQIVLIVATYHRTFNNQEPILILFTIILLGLAIERRISSK